MADANEPTGYAMMEIECCQKEFRSVTCTLNPPPTSLKMLENKTREVLKNPLLQLTKEYTDNATINLFVVENHKKQMSINSAPISNMLLARLSDEQDIQDIYTLRFKGYDKPFNGNLMFYAKVVAPAPQKKQ